MCHSDYPKLFSTSVGLFVPFLVFFDNSKLGFCNAVIRTSFLSFQELQRDLNFHQIVLYFVSPFFVENLIQLFGFVGLFISLGACVKVHCEEFGSGLFT